MLDLEPFDALALSLHHSPGVFALLVGSGLSRAAGIPTGWDITIDLVRRLAVVEGLTDHPSWEGWFQGKFKREPNYSEILDSIANTQSERRSILHSYIEPAEGEESRRPTKAHHAIAQLVAKGVIRVVVTTNFDRLLENALRDAGVEPTVIASEDALSGATPLIHSRCTVIKLHGDYLDTRIRNTETELASYPAGIDGILDEIFDRFGLLVVGWSGEWDEALRAALVRAPSRRYPLYWAARGRVPSLGQDLIDHRAGKAITIPDADSFFERLTDTIDALQRASRPHPQTVGIALELAKKYCRDDAYAVEWAEFVTREASRIREFLSGSEYPTKEPTTASLNELVDQLVSFSEQLRRVCLICGRWGTASANRTVARVIKSLVGSPAAGGGFTYLISLSNLPAALCFYWAVGGAMEREEYSTARLQLHNTVKNRSGEPQVAIESLPLATFETIDWKFLTGFEKKRTPASQWLGTLFETEAGDITLTSEEAAEVFDRIELLIALEFVHQRRPRMDESGLWFWCPLGRFIWKNMGSDLLSRLGEFSSLPKEHPLLVAGLLGGSPEAAAASADLLKNWISERPGLTW